MRSEFYELSLIGICWKKKRGIDFMDLVSQNVYICISFQHSEHNLILADAYFLIFYSNFV